ncbi:hypothetical protein [Psychroserpens mesophilus]|uniref:hypothetical protein n=1 Tax=Psychroserpens mesophilus TaxID=325473 RepID=UPI00058E12F0|nr:hypothetical protein [Psychroserpens mesophilus]
MKIKSTILISLLIFCSCKESNTKNKLINQKEKSIVIDSSKAQKQELVVHESIPIPELIEFVKEIEKTEWIPDTLRLRKKKLYNYLGNKTSFNGYPFYSIDYENTDLKKASKFEPNVLMKLSPNLDIELFKNTKSIWGYFYRDKNGTNTISDGIIEQWEFETESDAIKAIEQIQLVGHFVYFNTMPFHCRVKNYLITFRTRAMMFSYDQKIIFEKFKNKNCT